MGRQQIFRWLNVFVLLGINDAFAQANLWQNVSSPYGGSMAVIAIDSSNNLLMGTLGGGVWTSSNEGKSWRSENNGLTSRRIRSLKVSTTGTVFALTDSSIFVFSNQADHWQKVALPDSIFANITAGPKGHILASTKHGTLFCSKNDGEAWIRLSKPPKFEYRNPYYIIFNSKGYIFIGSEPTGIFRSTDNGENWSAVNAGLDTLMISDLAIDKEDRLYGINWQKGVYTSEDNGDHWKKMKWNVQHPGEICVTPAGDMYLTRWNPSGLYYSNSHGKSWDSLPVENSFITNILISNERSIFAIERVDEGSVLLKSADHGKTWKNITASIDEISSLSSDSKGRLYAGAEWRGVLRSSDFGSTWSYINKEAYAVRGIAAKSNGTIAVAYNEGFVGTEDDGRTWTHLFSMGLTDSSSRSIHLSRDGSIYACAEYKYVGHIDSGGGGLYVSKDNIKSWSRIEVKDTSLHRTASVTIKGWKEQTPVYSLNTDDDGNIFAAAKDAYDDALFKSTDKGKSWKKLGFGKRYALHQEINSIVFGNAKEIFVATDYDGCYRSTDDGITFHQVMNGLRSSRITQLLKLTTGDLVAATPFGVYRLPKHGITWQQIAFPKHQINSVLELGDYFFVSVNGYQDAENGLYRTKLHDFYTSIPSVPNESENWTEVSAPSNEDVKKLIIDNEDHLFLNTAITNHLYRSTNQGMTWERCSRPFQNINEFREIVSYPDDIEAISSDPRRHSIYMIDSDSLFQSTDDGYHWIPLSRPFPKTENQLDKPRIKTLIVSTNGEFLIGAEDRHVKEIYEPGTTAKWLGATYIVGFERWPGIILRSFDEGTHWSQSAKGLPPLSGDLHCSYEGKIFAGTHAGIYKSEDSGYTWKNLNKGLLTENALYICNIGADLDRTVNFISTRSNGDIYVIKGGMLYLSSTNGESWASQKFEIDELHKVLITKNNIMVASSDVGVFLSNNYGESWTPFGSGLTSSNIIDIEIDTKGFLFAVSSDGHIFKTHKTIIPKE